MSFSVVLTEIGWQIFDQEGGKKMIKINLYKDLIMMNRDHVWESFVRVEIDDTEPQHTRYCDKVYTGWFPKECAYDISILFNRLFSLLEDHIGDHGLEISFEDSTREFGKITRLCTL